MLNRKLTRNLAKTLLLGFCVLAPNNILNVSVSLNQSLIQNTFTAGMYGALPPIVLGNMFFALFVPLGAPLSNRYGPRKMYRIATVLFLLGAAISASSESMFLLSLGRILQGMASGSLLMVVIPMMIQSFAPEKRNYALATLLAINFGSTALGSLLGSYAYSINNWRWLFIMADVITFVGLLVGNRKMPEKPATPHGSKPPRFDVWCLILLVYLAISMSVFLIYLQQWGLHSRYVWPFLVISLILFLLLNIGEMMVKDPVINVRLLLLPKPFVGATLAIVGNILIMLCNSAMNGFARNILAESSIQMIQFNSCLFGGVLIAALIALICITRIGPGGTAVIGTLLLIIATSSLLMIQQDVTIQKLSYVLVVLSAGSGITMMSGFALASMGGPLPTLPKRMGAAQFLRTFTYTLLAPLVGFMISYDTTIHYAYLAEQVTAGNPHTLSAIQQIAAGLAAKGLSPVAAQRAAVSLYASRVNADAMVLAYNHIFYAVFWLSILAFLLAVTGLVLSKGANLAQLIQQVKEEEERKEKKKALKLMLPGLEEKN